MRCYIHLFHPDAISRWHTACNQSSSQWPERKLKLLPPELEPSFQLPQVPLSPHFVQFRYRAALPIGLTHDSMAVDFLHALTPAPSKS